MYVVNSTRFGGGGGTPFDDDQVLEPAQLEEILSIVVYSDSTTIHGLEPTYRVSNGTERTYRHGGSGGSPTTLSFRNNPLIGVSGRCGALVDRLVFHFRDGPARTFGGPGGGPFIVRAPIMSLFGRSGDLIDQIGFRVRITETDLFGGTGGSPFSDPLPIPGGSNIRQIVIRSGLYVDSIATTYSTPSGGTFSTVHGGSGGLPTTIDFTPTQRIVSVFGCSGTLLDSIGFVLEDLVTGAQQTWGPFGGPGGSLFRVNAEIHGFVGRSGALIDAIGFYTS
jgi:hypothetical protein